MKSLPRVQLIVLIALGILTVGVCVISFATPLSWIGKPFAGFLVYDPPHVGSYSMKDWPGRAAGLKFLDRIVSVDGQPVKNGRDVVDAVRRKLPGTPVHYEVESKGETREVVLPVTKFGIEDFLLTFFITNFTCGFLLCILGFISVLLKPNKFSSWIFLAFCLSLGTYMISGFEIMSSYHLVHYHYVVACLYPVLIFHLALIFPDKKLIVSRFPAIEWLIYMPIVALIIGWQIYLIAFPKLLGSDSSAAKFLSYKFLGSMTRAFLLLSVISFIAVALHSVYKASSISARQRAKMILIGATIGWLGPVAFMMVSHILKISPTWNFLPFLVVFFPVSITYSIVRHNLFDADIIIRRTLGYVVVTGVIVGAYALVSVGLNVALGQYQLAHSQAFPILFTLGVILIFNPLRDRVQAVVDRVFFRTEYDYGQIVEKIGAAMTSLLDLGQILKQITKTFVEDMFIDTSSIMLLSPAGTDFQVYLADGERKQEVERLEVKRDDPLMEIIADKKREVTKYDVLEDPSYSKVSETCAGNFEALHASLMVPLVYQDQVIGSLNLGEKKSGKPFNREDIDLLRTLASQGAVAIENARLFQENLEKQRMEEELSIARDLQMSMLPATCPEFEGFEFAALSAPAKEVGGDFYDFIEIGEGKLGLVVGDVTGKSVSGALVMSASRSVFRMLSEEQLNVADIMARANRRTKKDIKSGMFVALLYAVLDAKEKTLSMCSAGQTQPIHISAGTGEAILMQTEGDTFPLGILEEADYKETRIQMAAGDKVILYTDGIVEAMNEKEEIFGFERLLAIFESVRSMSAEEILKEILNRVNEFAGAAEQHDDLTVIVVTVAE